MEAVDRALAVNGQQALQLFFDLILNGTKLIAFGRDGVTTHSSQIIAECVRQNKVTIGQTLHQCTGTESVSAMVREVSFTDDKKAWDCAL